MQEKKMKEDQKRDYAQLDFTGFNGINNSTDGNASIEKIEEIKKWLTDEFDLISWLDESPQASAETTPISEKAEDRGESVEEIIASYEAEIARLKDEICEVKEGQVTIVGGDSEEIKRKVEELTEENAKLTKELKEAGEQLTFLKKRLEETLAGLPIDHAEIIRKELELKEREKALDERERHLTEKEAMLKSQETGTAEEEARLEDRFHAELQEKENDYRRREQELKTRIEQLEEELKQKSIEIKLLKDELEIAKMSAPEAKKEIEKSIKEIQQREKTLLLKDEEIKRLREELQEKNEELQKIKSMISYKEEELIRREEDILYREKLLAEERRRFEEAKKSTTSIEEHEMVKRLEDLKAEIQRKEEELRAKEKYLNAKMEELRLREQGIIEDEIAAREEQRALEMQQAKVKTGNPRLDDLLLGGIPFGSNVLIHGPPFIGKEVMVNQFIAEGLKKGIPAIWVITDKTPSDIREEMKFVLSGYEEYERLGLVKYVDSYSRSMGDTTVDPYTVYIEEPTDHDKIMDAVEKITKEYKEKHEYYRLAFRTISTLIAYSDINSAFRFLSPFCGRRKRDKAVSLYVVEKGMHSEQEIQMLGSIMDGMIDFKVDQLRTYFAVIGICEVQSRAYIRYTASKHGLTIGSFALEHIR
ncbi:MAG: recombinase RecA [Methanomassiliicoccales archaeon]|nr:recombinase RecA [Methanomassiliicoccales archaeon]